MKVFLNKVSGAMEKHVRGGVPQARRQSRARGAARNKHAEQSTQGGNLPPSRALLRQGGSAHEMAINNGCQ